MSSVDRETILAYAHTLMGHIRITFTYLNIYKSLCDNGGKYRDAMNQTPLFFTMIYRSLAHTIMIDMCKLFEDNKQVLGIKRLYLICEQNQKVFLNTRQTKNGERAEIPYSITNILALAKKDFEKNSKAIENLKAQRDTIWAHNDKRFVFDPHKVENDSPVEWGEIEQLLKFASDFVNSIIMGLTNSLEAPFFNAPTACSENVEHLLSLLEKGMKMEDISDGQTEI